jgi:hypothetical protein
VADRAGFHRVGPAGGRRIRECVTVENVDHTVTVQILIGKIRNPVLVQVPTGQSGIAGSSGCAIVTVVAFATCDSETETDDRQERDPPEFSVS